jgi:replicative DNA helicase
MLSPEKQFFTKLIRSKDTKMFQQLSRKGLREELFGTPYQPVLGYVKDYLLRYDQLPSEAETVDKFSDMRTLIFSQDTPDAALAAIYDNILSVSLKAELHDTLVEVAESMQGEGYDPFKVLQAVQKHSSSLAAKFSMGQAEISTFAEAAPDLLDQLEGRVELSKGAPSSLLFVEDQSRGWQPAELTTIAARSGVGKTWMLLLNAVTIATGNPFHFYDELTLPEDCVMPTKEQRNERRAKVLILSLEMPAVAIMRRLACLLARVSYARYTAGELTPVEKQKMQQVLTYLSDDAGGNRTGSMLKVIGPDTAHTPEAIHAAAAEFGADVVMVDGFYLMPGPGEKRWEKVEANMQQLRLHSLQSGRHYMLATQLNKQAKTLESTDLDALSFSASIGHDSNNIFGLVQTKNDASSNILYVTSMKMRDGVPGLEYVYHWDHQEGLYTQQGLAADDSFEDNLGF